MKYSQVLVKYKKGSGYENFVLIRQGKKQKERTNGIDNIGKRYYKDI